VDRRKSGSKHHVLTDGSGTPMAATVTGANRHDVTQLLQLVDAVPLVGGKPGGPRRRFDVVQGDRAYHSDPHRRALRERGSRPLLARRNTPHGSGLGKHRWPVERTLSWMHQNRRLRTRYEKRDDLHEAFVEVSESMICWSRLHSDFC
jgi:transposase